ncbi:hypothetical protein G4B88_000079 [Cannabis sativa]|uniref:MATH domain-containing protein n=1 Tax=Cannabis sativa TaxID=3483 RepID=A0A7J6G071_CANSA|nr:hypothetical protein G4B88_000079 [Cannabis sativa]
MVFDSQSLMAVKVIKDQPLTTNSNQPQEISRWIRYVLPAHYLMKVESYSLLSMSSGKILTFYPNGDKRFDTNNDYVSLYLTISESNVLPKGWEVNVNFILNLYIYPKGDQRRDGKSFSMFLKLVDSRAPNNSTIYVEFCFRVIDQINSKHKQLSAENWFRKGRGFQNFMLLEDLHQSSNGYIVKDTLIVEVEFFVISQTY